MSTEKKLEEQKINPKVDKAVDAEQRSAVICEVCGHANPPDVGICEMCSNYLFVK